ncbi:MAG: Quinoprotein glucose dehydrogenase [candidate division WWE3 bacterium GW2011_GWA1_41_8]|uniref:Quinoprotein glucose dehydrogenase n=3 Tax=Katanobacteria TaxID=422282 RepID=A0A0G0XCR9_UNCKA|nr:MAG: Quinoprotein glucose dehydrogenase [candidate division WWE3 bacterium GW2011_GWB1_41_6]KKS22660.1 MAG: Quinoprotein glucose dehydrogenase [candidate division WWE3 bacterium GW2011_GWA1_41_8]OGC57045.1 MAG: hypothetical protein A2976_02645 [candidate division WWE3 bacterium RIFCSPLOWO2_01_FULL_41_9]
MGRLKKYLPVLLILAVIISTVSILNLDKITGNNPIITNTPTETKTVSKNSGQYTVETVVGGLFVPWSIVFTSEDRILVTERNGNIRIIEKGKLLTTPMITFPEVSQISEEGLMGLALDPDYNSNKFIYTSYAYGPSNNIKVRVVQLRDEGNTATVQKTVIDNIPAAKFHAGSRLKFGPDDKLYITTGDASQKALSQNQSSLAGKILRLNTDGTIPEDNPYPDSPVWSLGHRNPQGIDWHPVTKELWQTEHGPSGNDGPNGGDEVNIIYKGGNYGWPVVSHNNSSAGMIDPILVFTPAEAPASGMFYAGNLLPQFKNNFFFGNLRGMGIIRVIPDVSGSGENPQYEKLLYNEYGRIRDVVQGPDGAIYFSTSNKDGRGNPSSDDDRIMRIVLVEN